MNDMLLEINDFYEQMKKDHTVFTLEDLNTDFFLSLCNCEKKNYLGEDFLDDFELSFFHMIDSFPDSIKQFYYENLPHVSIYHDPHLEHGFSYLEGDLNIHGIILPDGKMKEVDFFSYCHELGHLPTLMNPTMEEAFEYGEVFPMFLEYLACTYNNPEDGYQNYLSMMKWLLKEFSISYLKYDQLESNDYIKKLYASIQKKEHQKYFYSFDFCLQLIDKYQENSQSVFNQISLYVLGKKSMKEISNDLNIHVNGCQEIERRLLRENEEDIVRNHESK